MLIYLTIFVPFLIGELAVIIFLNILFQRMTLLAGKQITMYSIQLFIFIIYFLVKHGIPTKDELEGLGMKIEGKWRKLGRRLGITDESLDEIGQKQPEKGYRMLKQWKQEKGCEIKA